MAAQKRSFSPEFKDKAVAYVLQQGKTVGAAARASSASVRRACANGYPRPAKPGVLSPRPWLKRLMSCAD